MIFESDLVVVNKKRTTNMRGYCKTAMNQREGANPQRVSAEIIIEI